MKSFTQFALCAVLLFFATGCLRTTSSRIEGVAISGLNWTARPNPIVCGGKGVVVVAVEFDVASDMTQDRGFVKAALWDHDHLSGHDLIGTSRESHALQRPAAGASGKIIKVFTIDVECDDNCTIKGDEDDSEESSPLCYVEVRRIDAQGNDLGAIIYTEKATITCFKPTSETVISLPPAE